MTWRLAGWLFGCSVVFGGNCVVGAEPPPAERFPRAAVAADHPLASAAGVEILREGGNVVDAAVATAFALSVLRPGSSGLGGGGFFLYWDAERQQATAYDYRERAPQAATATMFEADLQAGKTDTSRVGGRAICVPGQMTGLADIHARHGRLRWSRVLEPALRLAREGVPLDAHERETQLSVLKEFEQHPDYRERFATLWTKYLNSGRPWSDEDRFHSPQAAALEVLAREGAEAFRGGALGQAVVAATQQAGGIMVEADVRASAPVVREPLRQRFRDWEIVTMPPPSSGGAALLQVLQILEAWPTEHGQPSWEKLPPADRAHVLIEAFKHAFANRAEYFGDTDFADVPLAPLLDPRYARQLARRIARECTFPPEHYGRQLLPDDGGTTHFCVMDAQGNAVACTETINTAFGSFVVDPRFGIVLNNEMEGFTTVPGQPNVFGLRQSAANVVAPGKKPLSSMTPTIVLRDGRPVLAVGASGGPRIISATTQVLLHVLLFDSPASLAVAQPRLHHQWQPDELLLEPDAVPSLAAALAGKGHPVREHTKLAVTQAIRWTVHGLEPASDPRKHGRPAGY
jgi:gamma-glutamyltranspeptidase/glutathione hydrolase